MILQSYWKKYFSKIEVWFIFNLQDPPPQFGRRPYILRIFFPAPFPNVHGDDGDYPPGVQNFKARYLKEGNMWIGLLSPQVDSLLSDGLDPPGNVCPNSHLAQPGDH